MKLYNTLTRSTDTVKPISPPKVTVYTCGPTVYDFPHLGNWFTFIRYDLLVRSLKTAGLEPVWVMNITDVGHLVSDADEGEDKLEKGARREGKTAWDVASFYGDYFVRGLDRLNISRPDYLPKATEHIPEQIALVETLRDKGFTYTIDDGVYFDTSKFPRYADFAQLDVDEQQTGKRVVFNEQKRNPTDFALWKFSPDGQQRDMEWDSPFNGTDGKPRKGFPGWHLECSAMSMKYLGTTLDVHSGGIDHIPVHHTNEIAQSEAATGERFANYWMHANHITVDGAKISKSLGNGITLEDIEAKGYDLAAFRLHVLESHYRSQSRFSWESLDAARNRLKNWLAFADLQFQPSADARVISEDYFTIKQAEIQQALEQDLDTPTALRVISEVIDEAGASKLHPDNVGQLQSFLLYLDQALGLTLARREDISDVQKQLIDARETARAEKDWSKSDDLRDQLTAQGVAVRDTQLGSVWSRA